MLNMLCMLSANIELQLLYSKLSHYTQRLCIYPLDDRFNHLGVSLRLTYLTNQVENAPQWIG